MDFAGFNWILITVVGVAILALVLAWAALRNRADAPRGDNGATKRVYEEEDRAEGGEADNVP